MRGRYGSSGADGPSREWRSDAFHAGGDDTEELGELGALLSGADRCDDTLLLAVERGEQLRS